LSRGIEQASHPCLSFGAGITVGDAYEIWIRNAYSGGSWKERLKEKRLEYANKLQAEGQKLNQQIDLLDCLQVCDLSDLLLGNEQVSIGLAIVT